MSLHQLKLSDLQVNSCGKWTAPNGTKFIELPHSVCVFTSLTANQPIITDYEQATPYPKLCEASFMSQPNFFTGINP